MVFKDVLTSTLLHLALSLPLSRDKCPLHLWEHQLLARSNPKAFLAPWSNFLTWSETQLLYLRGKDQWEHASCPKPYLYIFLNILNSLQLTFDFVFLYFSEHEKSCRITFPLEISFNPKWDYCL